MNTGEMPLVETLEDLPKEIAKPGNEMLKGLCFNCDLAGKPPENYTVNIFNNN